MADDDLLVLLRNQPQEGMTRVVEQYSWLVASIVNYRLKKPCSVKDREAFISDVFYLFYNHLEKIDLSQGSVKEFITDLSKYWVTKAFDANASSKRSSKHKNSISLDTENLESMSVEDISAEDTAIKKEKLNKILSFAKDLEEPNRRIFIRKYLLGHSSKSIAKSLSMKSGKVDAIAGKYIKKLSEDLGNGMGKKADSLLSLVDVRDAEKLIKELKLNKSERVELTENIKYNLFWQLDWEQCL